MKDYKNFRISDIATQVSLRAKTDNYPVYSVTKNSGFVPSLEYFKKQVFSNNTEKYKVAKKGYFAYATIHLDEGSIGIAPCDCIISPMYTVFEINTQICDSNYLIKLLKSDNYLKKYSLMGKGSVERRSSISFEKLGNLEIRLPSLDEQRRIAAILDKAEALHAKRREAIANLDQLLQSVFLEMFGDPARNPKSWPIGRISEMLEGLSYGSSSKADIDGDVPILRMNNITYSGEMDLKSLKYLPKDAAEKYLVSEGDILFNRTNSKELVGKTAVYYGPTPMAYAGYLIRGIVNPKNCAEYISAFMNSKYGKKLLQSMCKSIVGMANINAKEFGAIEIPIPPKDLQLKFSSAVKNIYSKKNLMLKQEEEMQILTTALQQKYFS